MIARSDIWKLKGIFAAALVAAGGGLFAACAAGGDTGDGPVGIAELPTTCTGACSKDLYIVAHQDDDLLFMNPDVKRSIEQQNTVRVIYMTAGDNDEGVDYMLAREAGIREAYAAMAGVPNTWISTSTPVPTSDGNKQILRYNLMLAPHVSVMFLRLPNKYTSKPTTALEELWADSDNSNPLVFTTVDNNNDYSRRTLLEALASLIDDFAPQRLATLDSSNLYNSGANPDHHDHVAAAAFAFEANRRSAGFGSRKISLYRGYNINNEFNTYDSQGEPIPLVGNLSADEYNENLDIFMSYACHDYHVCNIEGGCSGCPRDSYKEFLKRQIAMASLNWTPTSRPTQLSQGGLCLEVLNGATQDGTNVRAATCSGAPHQQWEIVDGRIRLMNTTKCLDVDSGNYGDDGTSWGQVGNGRNVQIWECADVRAQRWNIFTNGQVRGVQGKCLARDLTTNNVRVWDCGPNLLQEWTVEPGAVGSWTASGAFADSTEVDDDISYYGSFRLADVSGDGRADACIRRSSGVWCALAQTANTQFETWAQWTAEFSDANGWLPDDHGRTLQFAQVDGLGGADVCARGNSGIVCWTQTDGSRLWTTAFANGGGWDTVASQYGSIRLADVTGDGLADVCGRSPSGIICAQNTGNGTFQAPPTPWLDSMFTDAQGWSPEKYGSTIQLGDINGDGKADVCGRGLRGIYCALSTGTSFDYAHWWSQDFSDADGWGDQRSRYGSIRLADVDGDGDADVCGRAPDGLWCAFSQGGANFDEIRPFMPREYTDALGWDAEKYGMTLQFGMLNNTDGHADVCGRGSAALRCGLSP